MSSKDIPVGVETNQTAAENSTINNDVDIQIEVGSGPGLLGDLTRVIEMLLKFGKVI